MKTKSNASFYSRFGHIVDICDETSDFVVSSSDFFQPLCAIWSHADRSKIGNLIMDAIEKIVHNSYARRCSDLSGSHLPRDHLLNRLDSLLAKSVTWVIIDSQITKTRHIGVNLFDALRSFMFTDSTVVMIETEYDEYKASVMLFPGLPSRDVLGPAAAFSPSNLLRVMPASKADVASSSSAPEMQSVADTKSTPERVAMPTQDAAHAAPSASSSSSKEMPNQRASMVLKSYPRFEMLLCDETNVFRIEPTHPAFIDDIRKHFGFRKDLKIGDAVLLHDCPWHTAPHDFSLFRVMTLPSAADMCYILKGSDARRLDFPRSQLQCMARCPTAPEHKEAIKPASGKIDDGASSSAANPSPVDAPVKSKDAETSSPPSDSTVFTNEEVESIEESLQGLSALLQSCDPDQQKKLVVKAAVAAAIATVAVICSFVDIVKKRRMQREAETNVASNHSSSSSSPAPQQTATCAAPCVPKADDRAQSAASSQVKATPASSSPPATASGDSLLEKLNDDYWKRDPIIMRSSHRDDHPASSDQPIDWMKIYRGADSTTVPAPAYAPTTGTVATPSTRPHFRGN